MAQGVVLMKNVVSRVVTTIYVDNLAGGCIIDPILFITAYCQTALKFEVLLYGRNMLRKNYLIVLLFISLMLLSAGGGALAAGEITIGTVLLVAGLVVLLLDLYLVRRAKYKLPPSPPDS